MTRVARWIESLGRVNPAAVTIGRALSLTVRAEPFLVRMLRRALVPAADASAESDLWNSPLVEFRSPLGIMLRADVAAHFRDQLTRDQPMLHRVRAIVQGAHAKIARILQHEEELIFLGLVDPDWSVTNNGPWRDEIQASIARLLGEVAYTVATEEKRGRELSSWTHRALPRLPGAVLRSEAALALRLAAAGRVPGVAAGAQITTNALSTGLAQRLVRSAENRRVRVSVRRVGAKVELKMGEFDLTPQPPLPAGRVGAPFMQSQSSGPPFPVERGGEGGRSASFEIPLGDPCVVYLSANGSEELVELDSRRVTVREVDDSAVELRTLDGDRYWFGDRTRHALPPDAPMDGEEQLPSRVRDACARVTVYSPHGVIESYGVVLRPGVLLICNAEGVPLEAPCVARVAFEGRTHYALVASFEVASPLVVLHALEVGEAAETLEVSTWPPRIVSRAGDLPERDLRRAEFEALHQALLKAFPSYSDMARMLRDELDQDLREITTHGPMDTATYQVIEFMQSQGRIRELIRGAHSANPSNRELRLFASKLREAAVAEEPEPTLPPLHAVYEDERRFQWSRVPLVEPTRFEGAITFEAPMRVTSAMAPQGSPIFMDDILVAVANGQREEVLVAATPLRQESVEWLVDSVRRLSATPQDRERVAWALQVEPHALTNGPHAVIGALQDALADPSLRLVAFEKDDRILRVSGRRRACALLRAMFRLVPDAVAPLGLTWAGTLDRDPQRPVRGLRGFVPSRNGRRLSAIVEMFSENHGQVTATVSSEDPEQPLFGVVYFYFGDSTSPYTAESAYASVSATFSFEGPPTFILGAELDDGRTALELDLDLVPRSSPRTERKSS